MSATKSETTNMDRVLHSSAGDSELENYARGVVTGVMQRATPNVVGSLLARIRADAEQLERLREGLELAIDWMEGKRGGPSEGLMAQQVLTRLRHALGTQEGDR